MTRHEEITLLQSLKGDTYFAQKFGADIDQMCDNIKNDFPIEFNCQFAQKEQIIKKKLEKEKEKLLEFAHEIIQATYRYDDGSAYQVIEDYIGKGSIIKYKHSRGIELNEDEIDYLVGWLNV